VPMPITLDAKLDWCLVQMKASHQANVKTACLTVLAALRDEMEAMQACEPSIIAAEDRVLQICHYLANWMQVD